LVIDSDILARSDDARGGNITLGPFFSETLPFGAEFPTDKNNRVDVNADGQLASGIITTPDISFVQDNLSQLPINPIDTTALVSGSCIARTDNDQATFINTGNGGLPVRPGDAVVSSYNTGNVQAIENSEPQAIWQPGDPIIEPTGAFPLTDGRLVLSRECD
jgi:large exoprotein involved in heme utilization and adhesion